MAKKKSAKKAAKKVVKKAASKKKPAKSAAKSATKTKRVMAPTQTLPEVGALAPAFSGQTDLGNTISLKDFRGKWLILYFYPKDQTPGCTVEACDFRDAFKDLKDAGALILGVSKDSVESHQKFVEKQKLNFPLLSDADGKICEAYGAWQEKSLYGRKFMGIVRCSFLINPEGRIAKVYPKVRVEGHVAEILKELTSD